MRLAPFYHKSDVKDFESELRDASDHIEIIESTSLWEQIFPERDPDAEARLEELTKPETLDLLDSLNIQSIIIINPPTSSSGEDSFRFLGAAWQGSQAHSTKMSALVLDIETSRDSEQLTTSAAGKSRAAWVFIPLPIINFFFWDFEADTEGSAKEGLAKAFAEKLLAQYAQRPVRIAVLGAIAESDKQKNSDTMRARTAPRSTNSTVFGLSPEQLEWKASLGNPEAQLQLYWNLSTPERLLWLCRSADQEHSEAQKRLGILYENGAGGVTTNPVWAFVWYSKASLNGDYWSGLSAERILGQLNEQDAARAREMLENWESGQCKSDLQPIWTTDIMPAQDDHDAISTPP
ncbi:MAG: hypothetical protein PVH38_12345 [Gammaproteobacteria bacterium]